MGLLGMVRLPNATQTIQRIVTVTSKTIKEEVAKKKTDVVMTGEKKMLDGKGGDDDHDKKQTLKI
ncbi:hypothetical protein TIFTF001_023977 [Ficus carica]|uniref:Uncharacterized protein n=1 Tax=Ficus carica TaxID=3494 RepID=A0AA88DCY9_FICCA|nr:hypothetical protein TIFTF001_023977 [Ficus carica]